MMNQKQLQTKYAYWLDDGSLLNEEKAEPSKQEEVNEEGGGQPQPKSPVAKAAKKYINGIHAAAAGAQNAKGYTVDDAAKEFGVDVEHLMEYLRNTGARVIFKRDKDFKKNLKEGFETHVLCSECGSGELELSKQKTKIRCKECGNVGLTESIIGLIEGKSMKVGGGGRFAKLKRKLKGKVSDPAAVAAAIGRKKYGKKKFQSMASKGKKRASKNKMENC